MMKKILIVAFNRFFNNSAQIQFVLLLSIFILFTGGAQKASAEFSQRDVLIALYNSTDGNNWKDTTNCTDGDNWKDNTNWLGDEGTECDWYGVTCDPKTGDVIEIDLNYSNLKGSIPSELGNLKNLWRLSLNNNQLTGPIPSELVKLTSLEYLSLNNNQLTGPIPSELGNLKKLLRLSLNNNQLTGPIPTELQNLKKLRNNENDFRWNNLYTKNPDLRAFLNSKQIDGDWESFQGISDPVTVPKVTGR
jgi:hypothetical protein